jgi:sulfite reductase alpha subunit-like flavoprotein
MYEFRAAKVPIEYCMDLLPAMVQRGFSVASASNVRPPSYPLLLVPTSYPQVHPKHVDLLVAIVNYKSTMSVPRTGVCTDWISRLKTGTRVPMRIVDGTLVLPALVNGVAPPLIMVGPGTGVAPFRALVEERTRLGQDENLVFFGCRSVKQDYFYKDQWAAWEKEGKLTMSVAASRDQVRPFRAQSRSILINRV